MRSHGRSTRIQRRTCTRAEPGRIAPSLNAMTTRRHCCGNGKGERSLKKRNHEIHQKDEKLAATASVSVRFSSPMFAPDGHFDRLIPMLERILMAFRELMGVAVPMPDGPATY